MSVEERERRAELIMQVQQNIMAENQAKLIGKDMEVIVDDYDSENDLFVCRTHFDAPEIDGEVYIPGASNVNVGDIVNVHITESDIYDLYNFKKSCYNSVL